MLAFIRGRTRLWQVAGIWIGLLLFAFNLRALLTIYAPQYHFRNDFRLLYGVDHLVLQRGFPALYDLATQRTTVEHAGFFWQPFINPPPLVWLGLPFSLPTFLAGLAAWSALLVLAALACWWLAAPGDRFGRAMHLALLLGVFPVAFSLMVGQVVVVVALAVAAAGRLAESRRDVLAGIALSAVVLKPQLALLVPICVLVAGRGRLFLAWLATTAVLAGISLLLLGPHGLTAYREALGQASNWGLTKRFTFGDFTSGPALVVAAAAVLLITLAIAYRQRGGTLGPVIAAGILGSLLVTPYIGLQDLTMLVLAAWLLLRAGVPWWLGVVLAVGYGVLELAQVLLTGPVVAGEVAVLVSLLALSPDRRLGRDALQPLAAAG